MIIVRMMIVMVMLLVMMTISASESRCMYVESIV